MVVNAELESLKHFGDFLRAEDKVVFEDLLNQCKLYASYASTMASPLKEVPLFLSMIFGQHKKLWELEKRLERSLPPPSLPLESGETLKMGVSYPAKQDDAAIPLQDPARPARDAEGRHD